MGRHETVVKKVSEGPKSRSYGLQALLGLLGEDVPSAADHQIVSYGCNETSVPKSYKGIVNVRIRSIKTRQIYTSLFWVPVQSGRIECTSLGVFTAN